MFPETKEDNRDDMANHYERLAALTTRLEEIEDLIMLERKKEAMKAEMDLQTKMEEETMKAERDLQTKMEELNERKMAAEQRMEELEKEEEEEKEREIKEIEENLYPMENRSNLELEKIKRKKIDQLERNQQRKKELEDIQESWSNSTHSRSSTDSNSDSSSSLSDDEEEKEEQRKIVNEEYDKIREESKELEVDIENITEELNQRAKKEEIKTMVKEILREQEKKREANDIKNDNEQRTEEKQQNECKLEDFKEIIKEILGEQEKKRDDNAINNDNKQKTEIEDVKEMTIKECVIKPNEETMNFEEDIEREYECKKQENTQVNQTTWLQITPTTTTTTTTTVTCLSRPISSVSQPDYYYTIPEQKNVMPSINSDGPTTVAEALRRYDKLMKDWPKFDSNKLTDFVTWQTKIEQIRKLTCQEWDEDILVKCLSIKTLNGNASQFFTQKDEEKRAKGCPKWTLEEFFEHVLETNCAHSTPDIARRNFEEDKMTAEELEKGLFRQFATRIQLKIKIAYRQEKQNDNEMLDRMVKDKFKKSLPQNIREQVERHTNFMTSLNKLISLAEKEFQINSQRKTETVNNISLGKEENNETEDVAAMLGGNQRNNNNMQRGGYRGMNGRGRGGTRKINGNCFNCNEYGHKREDCTKPKREWNMTTRGRNNNYGGNYRGSGRQYYQENKQERENEEKFEKLNIFKCKVCGFKSLERKCSNCEIERMTRQNNE